MGQYDLIKIITDWRAHSPFEITAVFRKSGGEAHQPSWLEMPEIGGNGFVSPRKMIARYAVIMLLSPFYHYVRCRN
jgi:hypothetical protein